jgi:hypothetical protein
MVLFFSPAYPLSARTIEPSESRDSFEHRHRWIGRSAISVCSLFVVPSQKLFKFFEVDDLVYRIKKRVAFFCPAK